MANGNPYTDKAMKDHANTYHGFLTMLKWGIAAVALVLAILAIFVA